jgi:sodium/hydrogen antiporter
MLLNISVFMWFGVVCPWPSFRVNNVIPIYRLIFLGVLILLLRRIPVIMAMWKHIHQIDDYQQALFVGFFGPIGVSAIFYLYVSLDFLNQIREDGEVREDAKKLGEVMNVVIWFLAICSIVVHGLSVPMAKLGYHLPRTVSQALSTSQDSEEPHIFLRHFSREGRGDGSTHIRRRKNQNPERRPSDGAFTVGGRNPRRNQPDQSVLEQSAAEPERPIRYPETGQNTPMMEPSTPLRQNSGDGSTNLASSETTADKTAHDLEIGLVTRKSV